jgi:soluble lytic murein transglycosylase-like protein
MIMAARMIAACVFLAANTYEVPPAALMGIYQIEAGRLGQEVPNSNGTSDLGPMQINTSWLPELSRRWGVSNETARRLVRDDACTNVGVAAWILKQELDETGGNIAKAIAYYHSHTPLYGHQYKSEVVGRIARYQLIPLNK